MAHSSLPEPHRTQPHLSKKQLRQRAKAADLLAQGMSMPDAVAKLSGGDPAKAKRWRERLRQWWDHDPTFQAMIVQMARADLGLSIPSMTQALIRRANRGRMDALRTAFEVTGFHNPKVQHEHSGEIKIKVEGVKRPEPVVDAEVVED